MHTIEWVFSGVGVLVLSWIGLLILGKFKRPPPSIPRSTESLSPAAPVIVPSAAAKTTLLHKSTSASLDHWLDETVRIRKGDYHSVKASYRTIRIEVTDIRMAPISDKFGMHTKDKLAVELYVNLGGGVLYGGTSTVFVDVNKFLVPCLEFEEGAESLFFFLNKDSYCSFMRISVTHINAHDGCADISLVDLSVGKTDSTR